ncbi:MAG: hypothetical protein Q7V05_12690 [Methanoregula sp.]|nr:hypothetical protein [Methanoregula sp.]
MKFAIVFSGSPPLGPWARIVLCRRRGLGFVEKEGGNLKKLMKKTIDLFIHVFHMCFKCVWRDTNEL